VVKNGCHQCLYTFVVQSNFGWEAPEFAHLPLIMKPVGNGKLSKRDGQNGISSISIGLDNKRGVSSGYREKDFPRSRNLLALRLE
jgi:glutamyl-tRNA synthetase